MVTVEQPEVSRHKCLIYEGHPSEQLPVVVPMFVDALNEGWRCLYLGDPESITMVVEALSARGVDTTRDIQRGALIFSSDRSHLDGGNFEPPMLVNALRLMIDEAVRDGYQGLCATGDMMWELGEEKNFERLREYEQLLEEVFLEKPHKGICQYRKDVVPAQAITDALLTHRSVYIDETLTPENVFYMPPALLREGPVEATPEVQGRWMWEQLLRVMKAEQRRDRAIESLRRSEAIQRQLAEMLSDMNKDLEARVRQRTAELEAANQELEAFSYSVSHDLRAPLRAVAGYSRMLSDEFGPALGEEGLAYLERVHANVRRMNEQIDGMLALARLSTAELRREDIDLSEMVASSAQELRSADPERKVEVVIQPDLHAYGDRLLMRSMVDNLMANAWKFTAEQSEPRIEFGTSGKRHGRTVFFVKDNGAGFDMKYADKLFGTFQRLHSQQAFAGTGIGLATVRRIIQRHDGEIWAEGEPEKGATFSFSLPSTP